MIRLLDFRGYISKISGLNSEIRENSSRRICKAYERWGKECIHHIHGSFSFVLSDDSAGEIIGFRDSLGTQPLYYSTGDEPCKISCHIREITEQARFDKQLDRVAFYTYLRFGYPAGDRTLYRGIYKVPAGCIVVLKAKTTEVLLSRYWSPVFSPDYRKSLHEWTKEIGKTTKTILAEDLFSKKAGCFLSSGVDSSYLLAMSDAEDAYGAGYTDIDYDESAMAENTAVFLRKKFHRCIIEQEEYFAMVSYLARKRELPLGDASSPAFALVCKKAGLHHKWMYSGEGPDELFAGYYEYEKYLSGDLVSIPRQPVYIGCSDAFNREQLRVLLKEIPESFTLPENIEKSYLSIDQAHSLNRFLWIDLTLWMEGDIFLNLAETADIFDMQIRIPYCDRRMVDLALSMPEEMKRKENIGKYAFRTCASQLLPEEVAFGKKVGFAVPVRKWMTDDAYRDRIENILFGTISESLFRLSALKKIWNQFLDGDDGLWNLIYTLYEFILWYGAHF